MMSQRRKDLLSSICLFLLGMFLAFQSVRLSIWGRSEPEAGFFPFVIAVIIIGSSLLTVGRSVLNRTHEKGKPSKEREGQGTNLFRVCSYGILMLLFGLSVSTVGFFITSVLFLFLILKYVEGQSWKVTILLGAASILVSYVLFVYLLKVPFPKGVIKL